MKTRSLLELRNGKNSSLVLAAERTRRKDPLENLNYYTGGWNISDKHYFAVSSLCFFHPSFFSIIFSIKILHFYFLSISKFFEILDE